MHFRSLLQLFVFCHIASSAWIPEIDVPAISSEKVHLLHNPNYNSDGPSQYARSLLKHNIISPSTVFNSKRNRHRRDANTASESATYVTGGRYLVPLTIGEGIQAQTFAMELDTGSDHLWVYSSYTPVADIVGPHTIYQPGLSAIPLDTTWAVGYNDGSSASGIVFSDTVSFGGIQIKNQAVEAATQLSGELVGANADGILGMSLGTSQISIPGIHTVLQNLIDHPLQASLFTVSLTRPSEGVQGFYTFGHIDQQLIGTQSISYTDVINTQGFWEFSSTTATIGGKLISRPAGNTAVADTGTTLILVDDALLSEIYTPLGGYYDSAVNDGQGAWLFPVSALSNLPTITLPIGNFAVTLQDGDLGFQILEGGWVYGSLQSRQDNTYDIFGDVWLANLYVIFDLTTSVPRIGVVPRAYGA
jgi:Eukaryotic aspartyl protease